MTATGPLAAAIQRPLSALGATARSGRLRKNFSFRRFSHRRAVLGLRPLNSCVSMRIVIPTGAISGASASIGDVTGAHTRISQPRARATPADIACYHPPAMCTCARKRRTHHRIDRARARDLDLGIDRDRDVDMYRADLELDKSMNSNPDMIRIRISIRIRPRISISTDVWVPTPNAHAYAIL